MTFRSLLVIILIFFSPIVFSQNIADCIDAVAVCETTSVNYEVIGIGDVNDLPIGQSGCLGDGGNNTGIESFIQEMNISIYPNPASDLLAIQCNELNRENLSIELINNNSKNDDEFVNSNDLYNYLTE